MFYKKIPILYNAVHMAIRRKKPIDIFSSLIKLAIKNYLILIIIGCVGIVGVVSTYKLYIKKPTYVYVKVKVGQGYWWASTQRPNSWFVQAIKKAKEEKDVGGNVIAKISNVTFYPFYGSNQFDVYVTARLLVTTAVGGRGYNFKRESIAVGSPIDFEFKNVQFSGTVIMLDDKPIKTKTIEKVMYLTKKYSYPWEYEEIKIGDYFFDNNEKVLEILEKAKGETNEVVFNDLGKLSTTETESYDYIVIKVKVRVQEINNNLIYAEEVLLSPMRGFDFITNKFIYNNFLISKIE